MNRIEDLIREMKRLEAELLEELAQKEAEFRYQVRGRKVRFEAEARRYQRQFMVHVGRYLRRASVINIISAPAIWLCIVPALLMDLSVSLYQAICFRLYRIPRVRRSRYIVIDRHSLAYLNLIEKINCVYCGYFNGLIAYVQEIAARTEQYWCPIKHARRVKAAHDRYPNFFDYGDAEAFQQGLNRLRKQYDDTGK